MSKIQQWGNSQGIRLSKALLADVGMNVGDELDVAVQDGTLVLTPVRRVRGGHNLGALVRRIPKGFKPGKMDWGRPAGREVW